MVESQGSQRSSGTAVDEVMGLMRQWYEAPRSTWSRDDERAARAMLDLAARIEKGVLRHVGADAAWVRNA